MQSPYLNQFACGSQFADPAARSYQTTSSYLEEDGDDISFADECLAITPGPSPFGEFSNELSFIDDSRELGMPMPEQVRSVSTTTST